MQRSRRLIASRLSAQLRLSHACAQAVDSSFACCGSAVHASPPRSTELREQPRLAHLGAWLWCKQQQQSPSWSPSNLSGKGSFGTGSGQRLGIASAARLQISDSGSDSDREESHLDSDLPHTSHKSDIAAGSIDTVQGTAVCPVMGGAASSRTALPVSINSLQPINGRLAYLSNFQELEATVLRACKYGSLHLAGLLIANHAIPKHTDATPSAKKFLTKEQQVELFGRVWAECARAGVAQSTASSGIVPSWKTFLVEFGAESITPAHIKGIMALCATYRNGWAASTVSKTAKAHGHEMDSLLFGELVTCYATCSNSRRILAEITAWRERYGTVPEIGWAALIDSYRTDWRASFVHYEVIAEGCSGGNKRKKFLAGYLQACGRLGRLANGTAALEYCRPYGKFSPNICTTAIGMYADLRRPDIAEAYMLEARANNISVKPWAVHKLMKAWAAAAATQEGSIDKIKEAHSILVKRKHDNLASWTSLAHALSCVGDTQGVRATMVDLKKAGYTPNLFTWNCMVNVEAIAGNWNEAIAVMAEMTQAGVKPNDVTYCSLLTRQIAQGRVDLLEPTLDRMRQSQCDIGRDAVLVMAEAALERWSASGETAFLEEAMTTVADCMRTNQVSFWKWSGKSHDWRLRPLPPVNLHGFTRGTAQLASLYVLHCLMKYRLAFPSHPLSDIFMIVGRGNRSSRTLIQRNRVGAPNESQSMLDASMQTPIVQTAEEGTQTANTDTQELPRDTDPKAFPQRNKRAIGSLGVGHTVFHFLQGVLPVERPPWNEGMLLLKKENLEELCDSLILTDFQLNDPANLSELFIKRADNPE